MADIPPIVTSGALIGRLKLGGLQDRERLVVMAQNPANYHHWTKPVGEFFVAEVKAAASVEREPFSDLLRSALVASVLLETLKQLWLRTAAGTDEERVTAMSAAGDLLASLGALDPPRMAAAHEDMF